MKWYQYDLCFWRTEESVKNIYNCILYFPVILRCSSLLKTPECFELIKKSSRNIECYLLSEWTTNWRKLVWGFIFQVFEIWIGEEQSFKVFVKLISRFWFSETKLYTLNFEENLSIYNFSNSLDLKIFLSPYIHIPPTSFNIQNNEFFAQKLVWYSKIGIES